VHQEQLSDETIEVIIIVFAFTFVRNPRAVVFGDPGTNSYNFDNNEAMKH
jgi:hypothetical protein